MRRELVCACAALSVLAAGCGGGEVEPARFPFLTPASALDITDVERGVNVRHGEALAMATNVVAGIDKTADEFDHVVLRLRAYDDQAQRLGEYTQHPVSARPDARAPTDFVAQPALGDLDRRAVDLNDELDEALMIAGRSGFTRRSVVVDLFRTRGDWYVRWDGLLTEQENRTGEGQYGLGRERMFNDLLARFEAVARDTQPVYFIIGDEIERLLATDTGDGLSPAEWANFVIFYEEAATRIKAVSPDTKIGAGINWDRFTTRVAASYTDGEPGNAEIDQAFIDVILPLMANSDIIALKSRIAPSADESPKGRYQYLRRMRALYNLRTPVVFYGLTRPVGTASGDVAQRNHVADFADWVGGVDVEAVFWDRWINIDGADTADQTPIGRCAAFTSDESLEFNITVSNCNDGLFDSTFQTKEVWKTFGLAQGL